MQFSDDSDITLVVTSCGRFDLLARTLETFDAFNTAPINQVIITEDSGSDAVADALPAHWKEHTKIFVNRPKIGQLASIDLAYGAVKTPFIFHCEDDWEFYRPGFVEASRAILEQMPSVLVVWLRSFAHDVRISYPFHSLGERYVIDGEACSRLLSSNPSWQGFTFNPGLRRLQDYRPQAPFARFESSAAGESGLSRAYAERQFFAVILESDAVLHIGGENHVWNPQDALKKKRKLLRRVARVVAALAILGIGALIGAAVCGFD